MCFYLTLDETGFRTPGASSVHILDRIFFLGGGDNGKNPSNGISGLLAGIRIGRGIRLLNFLGIGTGILHY